MWHHAGIMPFLPRLLSIFTVIWIIQTPSCHALSAKKQTTYYYFAYGSNMCTSTMTNLRNLSPLSSTAALLPCHELRFNIPGIYGVEPSSASVEPMDVVPHQRSNDNDGSGQDWIEEMLTRDKVVHGTLYQLNESDFSTVCQTEGVPFVYSLHRCRVIPYTGNGKRAGETALRIALGKISLSGNNDSNATDRISNSILHKNNIGIPAFTLRASLAQWRTSPDIPPSQSYLNILIRGAKEYNFDEAYITKLRNVKVAKTWIGNGLAEGMLRWAERRGRGKGR